MQLDREIFLIEHYYHPAVLDAFKAVHKIPGLS